ncbi:MAG: hypothetical protein LUD74_00910, partial [Tannerellaceae bacterium]|nr:hypothetical protein [Tannerellaceae bacterium]
MKRKEIIWFFTLLFPLLLTAGEDLTLRYEGKAPTALVGNGKYVIKTTPERFLGVRGTKMEGSLRFYKGNEELIPASTLWNSTFFPGGVMYDIRAGRSDSLQVMYGVLPGAGFTVAVKCAVNVRTELLPGQTTSLYRQALQERGDQYVFFTEYNVPVPVYNLAG